MTGRLTLDGFWAVSLHFPWKAGIGGNPEAVLISKNIMGMTYLLVAI